MVTSLMLVMTYRRSLESHKSMTARAMNRFRHCLVALAAGAVGTHALAEESPVRPTAVVDLTFDEAEGVAEDRAGSGETKDSAQPMNAPERISSPFWNAQAGRSTKLDAAKVQYFQVANSPDLNHLTGSTLSFYFLNLHELSDATFRGIAAKRSGGEQKTNYGLNFQPSSKKLQVYVHDGTGYKVVGFPLEEAFGVRRLAHLAATFRPGDAPDPDADTDTDDLEIKLYVNGKPLKPLDSTGGPVLADAGWLTDVNFAGMVSDAPLTIGSSFPNGEAVSGLIDEFLVFNRPLSSEEAARLFREVAGSDGDALARLETEAPTTATPTITDLSPRGVQIGVPTRLTISGQNLAPNPTLTLLGRPLEHSTVVESTPERIVAEITLPADHTATLLPLAIRTDSGVSASVPLPADRLPQRMLAEATNGQPAELPAAYTGVLNGTDRPRILIEGKAGQKLVAEVELKRLGGAADPVIELKSENETPLAVVWGRSQRAGDPRLVATLPQDGRYFVELHDLAYKAPRSPFRLLLGDLRLMDSVVPPAVVPAEAATATAVGVGIAEPMVELALEAGEPTATIGGPAAAASQGILPIATQSDGRELTEAEASAEVVDLAGNGLQATYVTGQLATADETDRILIRVPAGQAIDLRAEAKSWGSPVEPVLTVFQNEKRIGRQAAKPGDGAASLTVTPKEDGQIEVHVADRLRGHGADRLYRLRLAPAGTPEIKVTVLDEAIVLPATGRGVMRIRVERRGDLGPIRMIPDEAAGVAVEPTTIPPGPETQNLFITVNSIVGQTVASTLRMTVEADTPNGPLRRAVEATPGKSLSGFDASRPYFETPIVSTTAAPAVEIVRLPAAAFKGVTETVGLQVVGDVPAGQVVRFSLVSDEPARPNDPSNAAAGNKPMVRLAQDAVLASGMTDAIIPLEVPADVAVNEIGAVIKAEVVPHAWSNRVAAVGYSAPFRLAVKDAVANAAAKTAPVLKIGENAAPIVVERQEGFTQPVRVELRGLPAGYTTSPTELPAAASEASLAITVPEGTAAGAVNDVELVVLGPNGTVLKSVKPFAIEVQP